MEKLKLSVSSFIVCLVSLIAISGCTDHIQEKWVHKVNVPIYQTSEQFRKSISVSAPEFLKNPGKIYAYGKYLFVNELTLGVHIYDNSTPSAPENLAFLPIAGNVDISIRNNYLYADNYVDLLIFDIRDISNIKLVKRYENIFPKVVPAADQRLPMLAADTTKGIVVGWEIKEVSENVSNQIQTWETFYNKGGIMLMDASSVSSQATSQTSSGTTTGTGGSTARFTIYNNYLYALNANQLLSFNIDNASSPTLSSTIYVWRNPETLFPYKGNLFIGTTTGMMIYGLNSPDKPQYVADVSHFRSCDPVVVEDNYAYVTLRAGSGCGSPTTSQFIIYDISTITNPVQLNQVGLSSPFGLGVSKGKLFVCDGDAGLKVYDVSVPKNVSLIKQFVGINAYDVIPLESTLLMIGKDGLYQYDFSDLANIKQISKIEAIK